MLQERLGGLFRKRSRRDSASEEHAEDAPGQAQHEPEPPDGEDPGFDVVSMGDEGGQSWEDLLCDALQEPRPSPTSPGSATGRSPAPEHAPPPGEAPVPMAAGGTPTSAESAEAAADGGGDDAAPSRGRDALTRLGTAPLGEGRRLVHYAVEVRGRPQDDGVDEGLEGLEGQA